MPELSSAGEKGKGREGKGREEKGGRRDKREGRYYKVMKRED